jgi:hypothetical protein
VPIFLLETRPSVTIEADDPLAAEALEHWAAKLTLRAQPGDAAVAQQAQKGSELIRAWRKENGR